MSTPRQKIEQFFSAYREQRYSRGQILVFNGEVSKDVFLLMEGRVKKCSTNYKSEEIILTTFKPGSFFPISQAIQEKMINHYFYIADTDVIVRRAPAQLVVEYLEENPDVMMALLRRVYSGLDEMLGRVVTLMATNALGRVVYELFTATRRFGVKENDHYVVDINEVGLAARTGLSRETVNREISKLKRQDLIEVERRGIIVKDLGALERRIYREIASHNN